MSRTKISITNIIYKLSNVLLTLILMFVVRTLFINTLGVTYLGINGLFNNIFQFVSLAELGIGHAIAYRLYEPLTRGDKRRIVALMGFFKKAYLIIAIIIFLISLLLLPFLNTLVDYDGGNINIYVIYAIFLAKTLSTYTFFAYKMTLLKADQREYVLSKFENLLIIVKAILEMLVLYFLHSFTLYLLVYLVINIARNLYASHKVDKDYPYLKDYDVKIDREELKDMYKDFFAAFLFRINSVVVNATDNIVLSIYVGLNIIGYYSNYTLLTSNLSKFINPILLQLKASMGNYIAEKGQENSISLIKLINVLVFILYGGAAIGVLVLSNKFITIWLNSDFTLSYLFVIILSIDFYFKGLVLFLSQIRSSMGLFQQLKIRPILSIMLNIIFSVILVQRFSIEGVLLGTVLSTLLTTLIIDPYVIFKTGFNIIPVGFYIKNIYFFFLIMLTGSASIYLTQNFPNTIIGFIISFLITCILIIVIFILGTIWLDETKDLLNRILKLIRKRRVV